jgi:beta-lactam-binding protein with PASTA domain
VAPRTTAGSPTAPTSSADDTVQVAEEDYIGEDVRDAEKQLKDLGLVVEKQELANDGTHEENTVESVDPNGTLHKGDQVTISYWGKPTVAVPPPGHTKKPHGHGKGKR